jgi:neutral ceramidase
MALNPWPDAVLTKGRFRLHLPAPGTPDLPSVDGLLAGAAEVDITPPPGMPKAGHSKNAHDGTGFRTRLKAKVVHLRQGNTSIALIACDLLTGSAVVHHALAREVADDVPISGLLMTATHTHAGPGHFSGSEFYNRWASNRPGFDPDYTAFLVAQLAAAVREAVATRSPARVAFGSTQVWGLTRNRSHGAYVRNDSVRDKRTEPQQKYVAINPSLHLLRVDDEAGLMAAFTWFSIHGTGISHHDSSYNADVWAYVNGELANLVEAETGRRPISGSAGCTHGDMTPAVRPGMLVFPEAERVGRGIGTAAAELHQRLTPRDDVTLAAGLREIDLSTHPSVDGITLPEPRVGLPKVAGATENTTFLLDRLPMFRAGSVRRRPHPDHGGKLTIENELLRDRLMAPTDTFPKVIPFHLLHIGDARILGLPFEVTVEAGRRIAEAVGGNTVISSLANDHCDYLTTPEEYAAQHYEGASTLFGPRQQEFVAACARDLAHHLAATGAVQDVGARQFDFSTHRYLAIGEGVLVRRELGPVRFVEATPSEDAYWELTWTDVSPGDLVWHEPLVRVETEEGQTVATDQGWYVGVSYLGRKHGRHTYAARWYAPPLGRPGRHRFVLETNGPQPETAGHPLD